jgi:hypothetical protein
MKRSSAELTLGGVFRLWRDHGVSVELRRSERGFKEATFTRGRVPQVMWDVIQIPRLARVNVPARLPRNSFAPFACPCTCCRFYPRDIVHCRCVPHGRLGGSLVGECGPTGRWHCRSVAGRKRSARRPHVSADDQSVIRHGISASVSSCAAVSLPLLSPLRSTT